MPELLLNICIISGCWYPMPIDPCGGGVCEYTRIFGFCMPVIFGTTPLIRVGCGCCFTGHQLRSAHNLKHYYVPSGLLCQSYCPMSSSLADQPLMTVSDPGWAVCSLVQRPSDPVLSKGALYSETKLRLASSHNGLICAHLSHGYWRCSRLWCVSTLCCWMHDSSWPSTDDWYYNGNDRKLVQNIFRDCRLSQRDVLGICIFP